MIIKNLSLLICPIFLALFSFATTINVANIEELNVAAKAAKPGDIVILKNGVWNNADILITCEGIKDQPVTFKAQTAGKVIISGRSSIQLGGSYIVIDGFYFVNGYAAKNAVISFRSGKNDVANNCRVTNCAINDYNNPKRMEENYWVLFAGKNNRVDHCSFVNKKNMGVLVAVTLDDERSRENFHSIDHNYFGQRLPLASNSGEIIRVGVSQHALFNSNTQIVDNFFEHCDGETEIVSIKSSANVVRNNLFKECQGGVVLRHGNNNTVENNIFLGNGKPGTGGVRIINKGQWVVNNFFYECRGTGFRSPLSLMNGVPDSPPTRYVEVSDAVVMNNSFINCSPISFCEGSDSERSVTPHDVYFSKNIFYNKKDTSIYKAFDDISRIRFSDNIVNNSLLQQLVYGFRRENLLVPGQSISYASADKRTTGNKNKDSLDAIATGRLTGKLSSQPGYHGEEKYNAVLENAPKLSGARWFGKLIAAEKMIINVTAKDGDELTKKILQFAGKKLTIRLTGKLYSITQPLLVEGDVTILSDKQPVIFSANINEQIFQIKGGSALSLENISADLSGIKFTKAFITSDVGGSSNHSNFRMTNCRFKNLSGDFFIASKSTLLDSVVVTASFFTGITGTIFNFNNETDKKGYYNVEKISMNGNNFVDNKGQLLGLLRTGTDESTMGPLLNFSNNTIAHCQSDDQPIIYLNGVQETYLIGNSFTNNNPGGTLIKYDDAVRAMHTFNNNKIAASGKVVPDKFVEQNNNNITP